MSYRSYNFSTEPSSTSRFGSLSTTSSSSTYRPSYASGTYRSPRTTTSTAAPSSSVSSFISRYSSLAADKDNGRERDKAKEEERRKERELREKEREMERDREKERLIETSKKLEAELKESKPTPLKKSTLIAAKYGSSKDLSEEASAKAATGSRAQTGKESGVKQKKDTAPPVTFTTRYGRAGVAREKSREPSPATRPNSSTPIASRPKQRDPSPVASTVTERARSRDPSPAVETKRTGGYALAIASKLSGSKLPQQNAPNEYRRQSSGTSFAQSRARSRDPSPTVRTRTSREPSPVEQRRLQLANKMIATAARSRDPSPAPIQQSKLAGTVKQGPAGEQKQRFTSSITIKTGPGARSRDPSPAESKKIPTFTPASKLRSRDPSPADAKRSSSNLTGRLSRAGNDTGGLKTATLGATKKTRDPSPAISSSSKVRSRDPSPATVARRTSREPSPAESVREKYGLGGASPYRPYGRTNSGLGAASRFGASASPVPKSPIGDIALSYMTSSEAIAARTSRPSSRLRLNSQSREPSQCSSPLTASQIFSPEPRIATSEEQKREESTSSETTTTSSSSEESSEETESSVEPEPRIFIEVTLVTRGTSPTPPGATPLLRARRADMCKTIEKTIQKQLLPVETADKQVQSDRLDDPTKYLRYGQPSARSWSPFAGTSSPTIGYTRYSSASSRYSRDSPSLSRETSVSSSKSDVPEKRELSTLAARVKELSLSKSNSSKSTTSRSSTGSGSGGKLKTPPKQKSPEKPPPVPAKDSPSPVKSIANKDFRKSALNMGPAPDRPRKSSSSSIKSSSSTASSSSAATATPLAETNGSSSRIPQGRQQNGTRPIKRSDRSASSSSEDTSTGSVSSGADTDREQSVARTAANELEDASATTDASNANNELLMRAIQLATTFVNNQNRSAGSWYDNGSTTSVTESLVADPSGKSGWEAGTHYMESIKDDSSDEDGEDEDVQQGEAGQDGQDTSELQQATWWRRSGVFQQTATMQDSPPSARSFTYRIRRVESSEKPWWLSDDANKPVPELEPDSHDQPNAGQDLGTATECVTDDGRTTATSLFESQTLSPFRPIRITRVESGERAWWMKSTENVAAKSSGEASKDPSKEQTPESGGGDKKSPGFTVFKLEAEDEAWWEEAMADLARKEQSSGSSQSSTSGSREPSKEPTPEPRGQGITLTRVTSGEKAWWLYSSDKVNELDSVTENVAHNEAESERSESVRECSPVKAKPFKITRIESGEQPWWMLETSENPISRSGSKSNVVSRSNSFNSKSGSKQTSPTKYRITRVESGEKAWWMTGDSTEEKGGSPRKLSSFVEQHGEEEADLQNADIEAQVEQELQSITNFVAGLPKFPTGDFTIEQISETPPLGDRASPEGVEDSRPSDRTSPYDNIPSTMPAVVVNVSPVPATHVEKDATVPSAGVAIGSTRKETQTPIFISRHTNIDDLLGGSCHPLSPMMDRMFIMDDLQEITPKDVRITNTSDGSRRGK
uniref:FHOD1 N-terminal GTPase-binding domain-containing protein n=1 Tax=Anopheles atroparvus TaxID=41427 RepID=A0A182JIQ1_ANOAO